MEFRLDIDELEGPSTSIDSERLDSLISDEHSDDLDGKLMPAKENSPAVTLGKIDDPILFAAAARKRLAALGANSSKDLGKKPAKPTAGKAAASTKSTTALLARASTMSTIAKPKARSSSPTKAVSSLARGGSSKPSAASSSPVKKQISAPASKAISKAAPSKKAIASIGNNSAVSAKTNESGKRVKELEERVHELEILVALLKSENESLRKAAG